MCEEIAGRNLPAVISPLMRIEPVGDLPVMSGFETVIVTSSNAVRRLGKALQGRIVATVGEATAELSREFGANATCHGETLDEFLTQTEKLTGPLLHCRGVHTRGSLAETLRARGFDVDEAVIYDQVEMPLNGTAQELLTGKSRVCAPVFSPRSARLLSRNSFSAKLSVVAISQNAAEAWGSTGRISIVEVPTATAMCKAVLEAI